MLRPAMRWGYPCAFEGVTSHVLTSFVAVGGIQHEGNRYDGGGRVREVENVEPLFEAARQEHGSQKRSEDPRANEPKMETESQKWKH